MQKKYSFMSIILTAVTLSLCACNGKQGENVPTINLANDAVAAFAENYQKGDAAEYAFQGDQYAMKGATLQWEEMDGATSYQLLLSREKDMSGATVVQTTETAVTLQDLFVAKRYYWQVIGVTKAGEEKSKVQQFVTADTPRTISIEGVSNTRDIGGRIGLDGRRVKQGMLYRGARLNDVTEAGKRQALETYGIKTDLDLRNSEEVGDMTTSPLGEEVRYVNISCPYYADGGMSIFIRTAELAQVLKEFAKEENYPMLYHCSIGRDRTGTISMLIEGLLGVSEQDILMDYEMSFFSGCIDETPVEKMLGYIEATMTRVRYPDIYSPESKEDVPFATCCEEFMLSIGVTAEEIAAIRNIMLE
ncbi:MAG: tyrosine-protein phosphatase [Clostridia bacterium]|nr:tyrosine-protein phosphatase [Clostridia bacterium]